MDFRPDFAKCYVFFKFEVKIIISKKSARAPFSFLGFLSHVVGVSSKTCEAKRFQTPIRSVSGSARSVQSIGYGEDARTFSETKILGR